MLQHIIPASGLLFTLQNILWINIGVFIGAVFAAIPGLTVILCVILFLPVFIYGLYRADADAVSGDNAVAIYNFK